ncbi:MAG: hypothetical protein AAF311_07900 [Pseudomonadota bacterium]
MSNVVRPWEAFPEQGSWDQLITELYSASDRKACAEGRQPSQRRPLSRSEDIALMDDVLDALVDPAQAKLARPVLRHALKEIARATLLRAAPPAIASGTTAD